ncbi:MAG: methionine--tRNA ligase subunit beta [archaeon]
MEEIIENKTINYSDFSKLDIRIGTIIEAENVQNSSKLIKIIFDFSDFKRQVIAGIRPKYSPEDLIGKQIPVIINLEPRKLAGLESQGMILAIGDTSVDGLLFPSEIVKAGSKVH